LHEGDSEVSEGLINGKIHERLELPKKNLLFQRSLAHVDPVLFPTISRPKRKWDAKRIANLFYTAIALK
jgi:hypothetical protein